MKKVFVSIFLILFVCCAVGIVFPSTSVAQTKYYPKKVYVPTGEGSLKEITEASDIAQLYDGVRDKKCLLTVIGPQGELPRMDRFRQSGYSHLRPLSDKAVYIISCGVGGDAWCRAVGGVQKCCPPSCY